ncbi:MAG: hypothetical protein IH909_02965 [Proteobacteria bacterium]|nr:hypothetical protein [Pseudomonadota bacterium]
MLKLNLSSILLLGIALGACTSLQQPIMQHEADSNFKELKICTSFISDIETTIRTANVIDAEARRIPSYPYLRTNRFLSDFRHEKLSNRAFAHWVNHLLTLGLDGWRIELANLPHTAKDQLAKLANQINRSQIKASGMGVDEALQYCSNILKAVDLDEPDEQQNLKLKATTPDEYNTWQRVLGLYPITALVFRSGISRWHKNTRRVFALPLGKLPVSGSLIQYTPPPDSVQLTSLQVSQIINSSFNNALGIPEPADEDVKRLFDSFAPVFEIDVVTNDDRIGTVEWDNSGQAEINIHSPKVYRHFSYTRIAENILLQLNYTIWFPSRPKTSSFDLLGGHLDGITWRVTLLPNGMPWLYDTMHNCGCYHLVFPTRDATIIKQTQIINEPIFIPQIISPDIAKKPLDFLPILRPILRIAHGSHYIERVYFESSRSVQAINYQYANSRELRSLKLDNGNYRSLFGQDGIIKSSQRNERYLFWPMGIPSPGAMRQWGHHAIAFVGRRHFDDARLFEEYFGYPNIGND